MELELPRAAGRSMVEVWLDMAMVIYTYSHLFSLYLAFWRKLDPLCQFKNCPYFGLDDGGDREVPVRSA
jgi:hypothetical protein